MDDLSDTNSRRAFPLDSRTVWVEQRLVRDILLPRDNFVLGPGEYSPQVIERHVSTPSLGKYRGVADHFMPFRSKTSTANRGIEQQRSEYTTIFHEHDVRQPIDPKRRYAATPGPQIGQQPILRAVGIDGVREARAIHFGKSQASSPVKKALPDYDVNYDSEFIKPKTQYVKIMREQNNSRRRGTRNTGASFDEQDRERSASPKHHHYSHHRANSPLTPSNGKIGNARSLDSGSSSSVFQERMNSVAMPKVKTRKFPQLIFNDSSYKSIRLKAPLDLSPQLVNKEAKISPFKNIVAIPRQHKSNKFF